MNAASADLNGEWTGLFSYPSLLPTTCFRATLRDCSGQVSGVTAEDGAPLGRAAPAHATIEGCHEGRILRFTKLYDDFDLAAHPIQYEGMISLDGDEVSGTWSIAGHWSGTFLMVRNPAVQVWERQRAAANA